MDFVGEIIWWVFITCEIYKIDVIYTVASKSNLFNETADL